MAEFKTHRDQFDLVSAELIDVILDIDAQKLAKTPKDRKEFAKENKTEYYLAINAWLLFVRTYSAYGWMDLKRRILSHGLRDTILWCQEIAACFVDGQLDLLDPEQYPLANFIYSDIRNNWHRVITMRPYMEFTLSPDQVFLTMLRFLKRLSPVKATTLEEDAIEAFVANQKFLKVRDRGIHVRDNEFVLDLVRDEVSNLDVDARVYAFSCMDVHDIELPPGACFDARANLLEKLQAIHRVAPEFFSNTEHFESAFFPIYMGRTYDHVRVQAVPKNIKTARVIAMENTYRQAVAKRMFTIWQDTLPKEIDLHAQDRNRDLAYEGSITGKYATIDLHAASDYVRYSLVRAIYPDEFCTYLDLVRPRFADVPGREEPLQLICWGTMGNSLTFILESEVFWAIIKAALKFHKRHFGLACDDFVVYGDDCIVPAEAVHTVISFLEALGFVINMDKTYYEGPYRESCGAEYSVGVDVSSIYFPRFPVSNSLLTAVRDSRYNVWYSDYERLLALQHRLFNYSYDAALFLGTWLQNSASKVPVLPPGKGEHAVWGLDSHNCKEFLLARYEMLEFSVFDVYKYETIYFMHEIEESEEFECPDVKRARTRRAYKIASPVCKPVSNELLEQYLYIQFLKNGPAYATELDRLLGTSMPVMRNDPSQVTYVWRTKVD